MVRAIVRIALACLPLACQRPVPVKQDPPVPPVVSVRADSGLLRESPTEPRSLNFRTPEERDSLRAVLRRERDLWRGSAPRNYRFELNVACFCPGVRGWLTMEVRSGQPLRAFDQAGKAVPITDWNTYSIDGLFDHVEGFVDRRASVRVGFDPRWHFPAYVSASFRPGPDMWSVIEARGLRPIP